MGRPKRRRVTRASDAVNIDRSMDTPRHGFGEPAAAETGGEEWLPDEELLRDEAPPHY